MLLSLTTLTVEKLAIRRSEERAQSVSANNWFECATLVWRTLHFNPHVLWGLHPAHYAVGLAL